MPPGISSAPRRSACVANLAAMPIVTLVVMPAAVASVAAIPFGLDGLFMPIMGKGIGLVLKIAIYLSDSAPFDHVGLIPAAAVVLFSVALVLLTLPTTWLRVAAVPFLAVGAVVAGPAPVSGCAGVGGRTPGGNHAVRRPHGREPRPAQQPSPSRTGRARCWRGSW